MRPRLPGTGCRDRHRVVITCLSSATVSPAPWGPVALSSDLPPTAYFLIPGPSCGFFATSEALPSSLALSASVPLPLSSVGRLLGEAPPDFPAVCDLAPCPPPTPLPFALPLAYPAPRGTGSPPFLPPQTLHCCARHLELAPPLTAGPSSS